MRGFVLRVFLSAWLIATVCILAVAALPYTRTRQHLASRLHDDATVASSLLERRGGQVCGDFAAAVARRTHLRVALFDERMRVVCQAPGDDLSVFQPYVTGARSRVVDAVASAQLALVAVAGRGGATLTAAGAPLPGFDASLPLVLSLRDVALAILLSGIACFAAALYATGPLRQRPRFRRRAGDAIAGASVDVATVVRRAAQDAEYEARPQHKSVALVVAAEPTLTGDAPVVADAVQTLLRRAMRRTPEGSTVDVLVDRSRRDVIVSVRDHGDSMPPSQLDQVLPRAPSPDSPVEGRGASLDLATARQAIAIHGGSMTAENAEDGGIRVTIRIPIDAPAR